MKYIDADRLRAEIESLEENARKIRVAKESTTNEKIGADGQVNLCQKLYLLIDSLQQEQPEVDLEKEIDDYIEGCLGGLTGREIASCARYFYELGQQSRPKILGNSLEEEIAGMYQALFGTDVINRKEMLYLDTFEAIARHFAEWGAEHLRDATKMIDEGLEEAADKYSFKYSDFDTEDCEYNVYDHEKRETFIAGAEWQKKLDQKTIELAEDHAMLAGMNKMEQQMMEGAVEHYVIGEIAGHPVGPAIVHYDESLNIGDKVKVIVIKED